MESSSLSGEVVKKRGQVTYITPLRPPALASFRTWVIKRELVV